MFDANMSVNHLCSYLHLISFHIAGYHSVMWGSELPKVFKEPPYAPLFLIVNFIR